MRHRTLSSPRPDRGATALEYAGLVVLAAVIVGALYATGIFATIGDRTGQAVCQILGTSDCAPTRPPQAGGQGGPTRGRLPTAPPIPEPEVTEPPPPSPGASPVPLPVLNERAWKRTEKILQQTPIGRAALKWARQHGVGLMYRTGDGSYYDDATNIVHLELDQSPEQTAAVFVHETNHARNRNQPDVHKLSRAAYISRSLDEEAHGQVLAIEENQQLQDERGLGKVPDTLLQDEYQDAYNQAVSGAEKAHPLTRAQEERIGERAGEARVKMAFEDGEVVQSTDMKTYADSYGKSWDDAHKHHR